MENIRLRKPFAVANWKMAMTIRESLAFAREFSAAVDDLAEAMTIVLCPPYTALYALSLGLAGSPIELGSQNLCAESGKAHTGEISAQLLSDVGCRWVLLGHWEVRRRTGETEAQINAKMHAAFQAGLRPILLIGEGIRERGCVDQALDGRLNDLFANCTPEQAAQAALIYEPEWAIASQEPAHPDHIAAGCTFMRAWISEAFGRTAAEKVRIIYGGSVTPENAEKLLTSPQIDGLGAGRKGRDPIAFAQIARLIAKAKGLI
jgi:triosephosphate isomerase